MSTASNVPAAATAEPAPPRIDSPQVRQLIATLRPLGRGGKCGMGILLLLTLTGLAAYIYQLRHGLRVTAMNNYFSWGVYIIDFVFFIGISMAGTLISAMLRLTGAEWRRPITRLAEGITLFALLVAGPMVIVDMGRPDRFFHVFLYGRLQSPILWDVLSLTTYMMGSLLYLYLPMIPDMAILRDHGRDFPRWRSRFYTILALGWRGNPRQFHRLEKAISVMAIVIIPVAVSIHTVTSWIFGMTLRPGWHSTIIGPDFVVGALYSGIAAVITAIAVFRRLLHLEDFITIDHFRKLSLLLLTLCAAYLYFMVNEYMGPGYTNEAAEKKLLATILTGSYAWEFWTMASVGLIIPGILLALPWTRTIRGIVIASIFVNIGMWLKRYIIVAPTLASPFMPVSPTLGRISLYIPTWVEWTITLGAFAAFCLMYGMFAKLFPIVSIWETTGRAGRRWHGRLVNKERNMIGCVAGKTARRVVAGLGGAVFQGAWRCTLAGLSAILAVAVLSPMLPAQATAPAGQIKRSTTTEDGKKQLLATVTARGKPVENATVQFLVRRTFGNLPLGEDKTLDDGTAAVAFPVGLPGGVTGDLQVLAQVTAPANLAGVKVEVTMPGGLSVPKPVEEFPRALWAPQAPLGLIAVIAAFLIVVWGAYAFVVYQLFGIRQGARV